MLYFLLYRLHGQFSVLNVTRYIAFRTAAASITASAGSSKYSLGRMIRLSLDSMTGYSIGPLRLATWFGLVGFVAAVGLLCFAVIAQFVGRTVAGWSSIVGAVAGFGAVQLLSLGLLGEYVGRIYMMLQGRPTYFVAYDSLSVDSEQAEPGTGKPVIRPAAGAAPEPPVTGVGGRRRSG